MSNGHPQVAELDDELLEAFEVELVHLSPVHQSDVDVPDQPVDLRLGDEMGHPVILEELA